MPILDLWKLNLREVKLIAIDQDSNPGWSHSQVQDSLSTPTSNSFLW